MKTRLSSLFLTSLVLLTACSGAAKAPPVTDAPPAPVNKTDSTTEALKFSSVQVDTDGGGDLHYRIVPASNGSISLEVSQRNFVKKDEKLDLKDGEVHAGLLKLLKGELEIVAPEEDPNSAPSGTWTKIKLSGSDKKDDAEIKSPLIKTKGYENLLLSVSTLLSEKLPKLEVKADCSALKDLEGTLATKNSSSRVTRIGERDCTQLYSSVEEVRDEKGNVTASREYSIEYTPETCRLVKSKKNLSGDDAPRAQILQVMSAKADASRAEELTIETKTCQDEDCKNSVEGFETLTLKKTK